MLGRTRGGSKFYPIDYFIAMATLSTCVLLVWAVLGVGTDAAVLGRGGSGFEVEGAHSHGGSEVGMKESGSGSGKGSLQDILGKAHKGIYDYPTSFTQGIITKPIHSHNDYWRPVPFYTALSVGCISIEADVWLYNSTLYVGHEKAALTKERTFESLYLNPLLDVLKRQNPETEFTSEGDGKMGVFDTDSGQTLYLWVDVKTDGKSTWEAVVKALEPLRSAGYLSRVDGNTFTKGAVTVIGTGNTPLGSVQPIKNRDYFWDAPLAELATSSSDINSLISPIASTDFQASFGPVHGTSLNDTQVDLLREQVSTAHSKGIKVRYWNQVAWPISTRNGLWRQLISEGVDFVNADAVSSAAGMNFEW